MSVFFRVFLMSVVAFVVVYVLRNFFSTETEKGKSTLVERIRENGV